ncbi:nitrilase-related carbon-nitrogen hydrolase [Lutibaculum baratangense]|uniref:Carbon-nitrogen hydrolase n=1 Tax=Lutibaculum baratangense AMV1 TaxID=631454 RepID=V4RD60_9HYPH|nr:nitrilase-related carbon-nitrogen hydrolase [Lutibaculum baratangense]ESR24086.1 Carbon-nitrogen hydrolase [Lutibaculum baratangense AMV1]
MGHTFTAACVQLTSARDIPDNLDEAVRLIRDAAERGADFVQTPEHTDIVERDGGRLLSLTSDEEGCEPLRRFAALARELRIWLHVGSLAIRLDGEMLANRGFLLSPDGEVTARYDKIHLSDLALSAGDEETESRHVRPGNRVVACDVPWGVLGMTIGHDLRFPEAYRTLAKSGATILTCPASTALAAGEPHWHALVRARAIENGAFMIAAAQAGGAPGGPRTFGHSLIVGPWGEILAEAGEEPGVILAAIDVEAVEVARRRIPSLRQDRPFDQPPEIHRGPARLAS